MLKEAFERGMLDALAYELEKEAGVAKQTAKATWQLTAKKLQESLKSIREAAKKRKLHDVLATGLPPTHPMSKNLQTANRELLQKARPWLFAGAGAAGACVAGYGAYEAAKRIWPHAWGD